MSKLGITSLESDLLAFIDIFVSEKGYSPSLQEMGDHLRMVKSGVHRLVEGLEQRGRIRRLPNQARSISVVRDLPRDIETALAGCCRESGMPRHAIIEAALREYLGCEAPIRPQRAAESLLRGRA